MGRLLSGRVGLTSASGLTTDRYSFIGLEQVEPNLGNPGNNNYILYSDINGSRYWNPITPAGTVDGITVEDEGVTPVGFAGSITIMNFVGTGVTTTQSVKVVSGFNIGVATVRVTLPEQGIGIGSYIDGSNSVIEYLNTDVGLSTAIILSSTNMPSAERAWISNETLVLHEGGDITVGAGRIFIIDILNLATL